MKRLLFLVCFGALVLGAPAARAQEKPREIEPGAGKVREITVGDVWTGTLQESDGRDSVRGTRCHTCVVTLEAGKTYHIHMKADKKRDAYPDSLDSYLRLEDASGRHLDSNDDAPGAYGTNLDALIVFPCAVSGKYRISATTWDGGTGSYFLQVSVAKAVTPKP